MKTHEHHPATAHADHHDQPPHAGHDKHAGHDPEMFRRRFWLTLLLTVPLVVTSHMVMDWFGYSIDSRAWRGSGRCSARSCSGGAAGRSWPVRRRRDARPAAGDDAADLDGDHRRVRGVAGDQPRVARPRLLVGAGRAGHDHAARPLAGDEGDRPGARRARRAAALLPDEAERVDGDGIRDRARSTSCTSATSCWSAPAAGSPPTATIVDGEAELDESMITGESRPVAKGVGRPRRRRHGLDRLVAPGPGRRRSATTPRSPASSGWSPRRRPVSSRAQVLADRFAALLFYVATARGRGHVRRLVGCSATSTTPSCSTVTVLVIACPHALGLAIPLVIAISTASSAQAGILVKDRLALERMRTVDAVLFDKTGTLTKGAPRRHRRRRRRGSTRPTCCGRRRRSRPTANTRSPAPSSPAAASAATSPRRRTSVADRPRRRGRRRRTSATRSAARRCCASVGLEVPTGSTRRSPSGQRRGAAVLYLVRGDEVVGALALEDEVRPEARQAVDEPARAGVDGRDDHRRRPAGRRGRRRRARHRRGVRRGAARGQGPGRRRAAGARRHGRDGRRRRQRRPGARPRRRRHRDRRRHRRRHRVGRRRARLAAIRAASPA